MDSRCPFHAEITSTLATDRWLAIVNTERKDLSEVPRKLVCFVVCDTVSTQLLIVSVHLQSVACCVKCLCKYVASKKCRIYRWMFQICSALNHVRACILRNNMTDIVCLKLLHTKVEQADQTFILALIVSPYYVYVGWSVCGIT